MVDMLQNAFTFHITLDSRLGRRDAARLIGTSMLYQLQAHMKWGQFVQDPAHRVFPEDVLLLLSRLKDEPLAKMCVFLIVDGLEKLHCEKENSKSELHDALYCLCGLINESRCWVIAVASSTLSQPVFDFLSVVTQRVIQLPTTKLERPQRRGKDVFEPFKGELMQLLIDDMGGFGRALELLYQVMVDVETKDPFDSALVLRLVVSAMQETYPKIKARVEEMREAFLAVVGRRVTYWTSRFGAATLDDVISSGLIRKRDSFLECPYILYLMLDSAAAPWHAFNQYVPNGNREDWVPKENWGRFICKTRVLKSMAYAKDPPVNWEYVHRGAHFASECHRLVKEVPRKFLKAPKHTSSRSGGFQRTKCACGLGSSDSGFLYRPGSGESFLCVEDVTRGFFHEVQMCIDRRDLSYAEIEVAKSKAIGGNDIFVLYCTGTVSSSGETAKASVLALSNCAIVDRTRWGAYFGPFAARALFIAQQATKLEEVARVKKHKFGSKIAKRSRGGDSLN